MGHRPMEMVNEPRGHVKTQTHACVPIIGPLREERKKKDEAWRESSRSIASLSISSSVVRAWLADENRKWHETFISSIYRG